MMWSNDYKNQLESNVPLADKTWFKLGGDARWMACPESADDLANICKHAAADGLPIRTLGRGANVLIRDDGFDGLVIRLNAPCFKSVRFDGDRVHVGGGVDLLTLANQTSREGLAGLDVLAGIPGSIGGTIRMNAGGRYGQMSDVVAEATLVDLDGRMQTLTHDELEFDYRTSAVGRRIVVSAILQLRREEPSETLERFHKVWADKKASQPLAEKSAGCIFKNPPGESAGALIDRAGLKGRRVGRASISDVHANFIVAEPATKSSDILALIDIVRETVHDRYGVDLELEIDVW